MGRCNLEPSSTSVSNEVIALVDGHSFYVSCHRLFTPSLVGKPVCVLSNGDSAVVARSDEAKQLGVKMGHPAYELRELQRREGLVLISSNYPLYQDIHRRMMSAISEKVVAMSPYSVDEAFCLLTGMQGDWAQIGLEIQRHVMKLVGIPTGVGISRNRTTAKLANWASKQWKRSTGSVVAVMDRARLNGMLHHAPVEEVWGVGRKYAEHLQGYGITTAKQLASADLKFIRRRHGVTLERTARELNWEYCLGHEDSVSEPKQTMACTRTFPDKLTDPSSISRYICSFASNLGRKLRRDRLLCADLKVFLRPARGCLMTPQGKSATIRLLLPTNDTRDLIRASTAALEQCLYEGGTWIGAGAIVLRTVREDFFVPDLFAPQANPRSNDLMRAIDRINTLSGAGTIRFAGEHKSLGDMLRRNYPSRRFTTSWNDLPEAD